MSIFKSYDIRGIFPKEINKDITYKIGYALAKKFSPKKIVIGMDARESSKELFDGLVSGLNNFDVNITSIGYVSTPMLYYASKDYDLGVMITASHNPKEYNGMKICLKNAKPVAYDTGIKEIEDIFYSLNINYKDNKKYDKKDIYSEYKNFVLQQYETIFKEKPNFNTKIVLDAGNGMGSKEHLEIYDETNVNVVKLFCDIDCTFPNHEANPLKKETLKDLQKRVIETNADLGIALDGDGDRVRFVDELGQIVDNDLIIAMISEELLKYLPKSTIFYDLRSSKIVKELVEQLGGKALITRVGHSHIKKNMLENNSLFAGEISGHFYYRNFFNAESSIFTVLILLKILKDNKEKLSNLVKRYKKYFKSDELNYTVKEKDLVIDKIKRAYKDFDIKYIDGISVYGKDFWFNVRKSNTEPLLRLNAEANTENKLNKIINDVENIINEVNIK